LVEREYHALKERERTHDSEVLAPIPPRSAQSLQSRRFSIQDNTTLLVREHEHMVRMRRESSAVQPRTQLIDQEIHAQQQRETELRRRNKSESSDIPEEDSLVLTPAQVLANERIALFDVLMSALMFLPRLLHPSKHPPAVCYSHHSTACRPPHKLMWCQVRVSTRL
jgi:hypothetical protein